MSTNQTLDFRQQHAGMTRHGARPFLSVCPIHSPLKAVRGDSFRKAVAELEGYDSSGMGEVVRLKETAH